MLAELGVVGASGVTGFQAELVTAHEVVPFDDLNVRSGEGVGENDTSHGVAAQVGTMGIHLASSVTSDHINLGLVDEPDDLDVVGALDKLNTGESTVWDDTRAVPWLGAPSNHLSLNLSYGFTRAGWCPEAEIIEGVNERSLAEGCGSLGGRIALVVTDLLASWKTNVGIDSVRKFVPSKLLVDERNKARVSASTRPLGCRSNIGDGKGHQSSEER